MSSRNELLQQARATRVHADRARRLARAFGPPDVDVLHTYAAILDAEAEELERRVIYGHEPALQWLERLLNLL